LKTVLAGLKEKKKVLGSIKKQLAEHKKVSATINKLQDRIVLDSNRVKDLPSKKKELTGLTQEIAGYRNEIAQLMKFQESIGEGVCPFLKEDCQQIEGDLGSYFTKRLKDIQKTMKPLGEKRAGMEKELTELEDTKSGLEKLKFELETAKDAAEKANALEKELLLEEKELEQLPKMSNDLENIEAELKDMKPTLEEYRKKTAICEQGKELKEGLKKDTAESKASKKRLATLSKEMEAYSDVEPRIISSQKTLKALEKDNLKYEQNSGVYKKLKDVKKEMDELDSKKKETEKVLGAKGKEMDELGYDPKALKKAQDELSKARTEQAKISERAQALTKEEKQMNSALKKQDEALTQVKVLEIKITEKTLFRNFVNFIRETFRSAGPLVGTEMIGSIGRLASDIYCDIMSDHSHQLSWTKDYEIRVNAPDGDRTFKALSGGEQMSAALAVRFAMLKHLARSDIVFLDEPTANLDEERKTNLAQQITKVTGFKQMFIITHDDTFSQDYEYVIRVRKVRGVSEVSYQ